MLAEPFLSSKANTQKEFYALLLRYKSDLTTLQQDTPKLEGVQNGVAWANAS